MHRRTGQQACRVTLLSTMTYSHHSMASESKLFWLAFVFSLFLHAGFYYALPYLKGNTQTAVKRIEVELSVVEPPSEIKAPEPMPAPPPPQAKAEPTPIKPVRQHVSKPVAEPQKPVEKAPVLATESPAAPSDYVVQASPKPVAISAPEPVAESITTSNSASANVSTSTSDNAPAETASNDEAWDGYGQALYDMVSRNKKYPEIARRRNWQGGLKVLAKFILGKLVEVTLIDSTGHKVLDDQALEMVRKSAALLPVKGHLAQKSFTVTVPVDFKLAE